MLGYMPKPKTRTRSLLLRMTEADLAALTAKAAGSPLAPFIVSAALGTAPPTGTRPAPSQGPPPAIPPKPSEPQVLTTPQLMELLEERIRFRSGTGGHGERVRLHAQLAALLR